MSIHEIKSGEELKAMPPIPVTVTMDQRDWYKVVSIYRDILKQMQGGPIGAISKAEFYDALDAHKLISDEVVKAIDLSEANNA